MPTPVTRPSNIQLPFANSGAKNTIPVASSSPNASFTDGFPAVTMLPIAAGGVPPQGKDFNGILYDITQHTLWVNAGGQYQFDAALSTAIGGYPAGMVLQNNAGTASYVSAVANNTTDFNSTPSSIGSLWLPYSGAAFSNVTINTTGGTTVLTAIQAAAKFITVTGVLVSNATLTFPAALGKWTIINNTTGAFTVTPIALAGTGVPVLQGSADTVYCDATNIHYDSASAVTRPFGDSSKANASTEFVQSAISGIGGYYQDTGGVTNAYVITPIPALTGSYATGESFRIRTTRTNTGASTLNAGLGAKPILIETGGATAAGDVHGLFTVTYDATVGAGSWLMNGEALSELGACAKENIGQGLEDDGSGNLRVKLADNSLRRSATGVQTSVPATPISGTVTATAASNNAIMIASATSVVNIPKTTTTWNGWGLDLNALNGQITITPDAADSINGGAAGATYLMPSGTSGFLSGDGAGNLTVSYQTSTPGLSPAPKYLNATQSVAVGQYAVDTSAGGTMIVLTLPASPTAGSIVRFIDARNTWGKYPLQLANGGATTIEGSASNYNLNVQGGDASFMFISGNWEYQ